MTTTQLVQETVRSAPTEIWQNYDNKSFKDQRIEEIYKKVSSFWKNLFTLGLWGFLKKREIRVLIKDAVCVQKTFTLPQLQKRIKDLVAQNLKPTADELRKEFFHFKTSELSLLIQGPGPKFDPVTHWLGVKQFLRTQLYRNEKALAALDALLRVPKNQFSQAAAYLKGEAKSADAQALRLIARGYVETRNHPHLLATLPRRIQELFSNPQAQAGFQSYFSTLKWPELSALQQTVGFLRTSGASTPVQYQTLEASDHRFTYTKPELATVLLADPAPVPAHGDWAVFRNQMREGVYRDSHVFELLAPLFSLSEADLKQISLHFKGRPSSLPQEQIDAIVKAAAALKIYPELFLTLPLNIQKVLRKIPDETLAAAFLALVLPNFSSNLPPHYSHFGAEITREAIALAASDRPPAQHPAFLRDAPRSFNKGLGWISQGSEPPGTEIPFDNPVRLRQELDLICARNHLDAASRLMLERLLSHDVYGPPVAALNLSLNQLAEPTFFATGHTNDEPLCITIVEEEDHSLTLNYLVDLPVTDIYHSSVHEKGDGSRYKGDFRIAFTYRLAYDVESARHAVEGPFVEAPKFTFQPCPPSSKELFLPGAPPEEEAENPFATPRASNGAATPASENPFSPRPQSRGSSIFDDTTDPTPIDAGTSVIREQAPLRTVSRGSSIFDESDTESLAPELAAAAAALFDVPLDD